MRLFISIFLFTAVSANLLAQEFSIQEVRVLNLEEDKGPFATLNDEIIVWLMKLDTRNDQITYWQFSDIHVFSDSIPSHSILQDQKITLDSNEIIFVALVEMDNNHLGDSINIKLKQTIKEYYGFPSSLLKEKIRLTLQDDDILGITSFTVHSKSIQKERIEFRGMHLFNKYAYDVMFTFH